MAAVSQKVPNLLGGVSQQPDPVKLPGQVRAANNVYLDPTFGCRKRPATEYMSTLATDIPANAKWFPIFRDNRERYAVAIYHNPNFSIRVWDLNDGTERSVTVSSTSAAYFEGSTPETVKELTISDYTLLANVDRQVTMSDDTSATLASKEALVVVNQVSYNTTYAIDLSRDGDAATQVKVYRATGLEVIPGSYEVQDGGACSGVNAQNFTESSGGKTGLQFRLVNQCSAYLGGGSSTTTRKVKEVKYISGGDNLFLDYDGFPDDGYVVETIQPGSLKVRYDQAVITGSKREDYDSSDGWVEAGSFRDDRGEWDVTKYIYRKLQYVSGGGDNTYNQGSYFNMPSGVRGQVTSVSSTTTTTPQKYISRYSTDVILQNGGQGWRVGDTVTVSMSGRTFTVRVTKEAFTYTYSSAGSASFTTPADSNSGTLDIGAITAGLVNAVNAVSGFSATAAGNVIKVTNTQSRDFNISVRGGATNKAMVSIKGTANDVAELPTQGWDGFIVKVNNTEDSDSDDYYVRFTTDAPGIPGAGSWQETVAPNTRTTINSSTMPQSLVRQANGSFVLEPLNSGSAFGGWGEREVGDEKSNPNPSFVGQTISDMFFHANRLGFLSEDAVILSQPGDYFNFFVQSALAVSDADPIDLTASSTKPAILKSAVGTPKGLVLFAERSQFLLSTNEVVFAASTVKLNEISNYFYRSEVQPLSSGVSIAFISESNTYSKVMEMAVDSVENRPVVADITRIIPEYLPPNIKWGEVLPNNNMLIYGNDTQDIYVFKFFNNGEERQMAGWAKWQYPASIRMFAAEDDLCHIVLYDGNRFTLCRSELTDDPDDAPLDVGFSKFTPRLDMFMQKSALTIAPVAGETYSRITVPEQLRFGNEQLVFMNTEGDHLGAFDRTPVVIDGGVWYVEVDNELVADDFILGVEYVASVTLPSFFFSSENRADRVFVPVVEFLHLDLYYSGRYNVRVAKQGYEEAEMSLEVTPANVYLASQPAIQEISTLTVPIFSQGDIVRTTIEAPDPFPCSITGYSWQGHYNNRGISPVR